MDYSSSASSSSSSSSAPNPEVPIIYISTHGMYDVPTDKNAIEEDSDTLDLQFEIPLDMTILKFNFVPINVCNYGGTGTIGTNNVADYIHHLISRQLNPKNPILDLDLMMKIIEECVKKGGKDVKEEIKLHLDGMTKKLEDLRITYLYPQLTGVANDFESQKPIIAKFNEIPEVSDLMKSINNARAYFYHVDDLEKLSRWNISIPNKSGKPRYILDKIYSLQEENEPKGMDWNITMYKPITGTVEDIFVKKVGNEIPGTLRKMTLGYILSYMNRIDMKTVILLDQTCSVFREITPQNARRDVDSRTERRWTNTVKDLLEEGDTIYGGKRKKQKTKKNKKHKKIKRKNTKKFK
jgi:hypothetical protein